MKKIREKAKRVVLLGNCAITGAPSNQRNLFSKELKEEIEPILKKFEHLERVKSVREVIKADDMIMGCPVSEEECIRKIEEILSEENAY